MEKRFFIVSYKRNDSENRGPMTMDEAQKVRRYLEALHPENFYVIEEVNA